MARRPARIPPGSISLGDSGGGPGAPWVAATFQVLADLRVPAPELFDGVEDLGQRIRLLVGEISAFFERSKLWYQVSQREPPGAHVCADAEARFYVELDTLVRAGLGPVEADAEAVVVVSALLGTYVLGSIEASGLSAETAVDLMTYVITSWLMTRHPGA